jgi:hypothetical protein
MEAAPVNASVRESSGIVFNRVSWARLEPVKSRRAAKPNAILPPRPHHPAGDFPRERCDPFAVKAPREICSMRRATPKP